MANLIRLDKLRALARLYSDQRPGGNLGFIPDTDASPAIGTLTDLANLALTELYDLLVRASGEEYYSASSPIAIVAGTSVYPLPATFYQFNGLALTWPGGEREEVPRVSTARQRNDLLNGQPQWTEWCRKGCRISGTSIEILPVPTSALPATVHYIPTCPKLTLDADTFDGVNGWERLVALRMAMEMRAIEEAPFGDLERLYQRERERVEGLAADREAAHPAQIVDVDPEGLGYPLTRASARWWP